MGAALAVLPVDGFDRTHGRTFFWPAYGWLLALLEGSQVVGWLLIGTGLPPLPGLEIPVLRRLQPTLTAL